MTTTGENLNYMLKQVNTVHMKCFRELEEYIYYMMRCLGNNFQLDKLVRVTYEETANGIADAIVYPKEAVTDKNGIINPMFFYGYIMRITLNGIELVFTEDVNEFEKFRLKANKLTDWRKNYD